MGTPDVVTRHFRRRPAAEQLQRELYLCAQELEHVTDSLLPAGRETPERCPADEHRVRTERERRHDVGAAADAAVDQHLQPTGDSVDDLAEYVDRRGHAVELP